MSEPALLYIALVESTTVVQVSPSLWHIEGRHYDEEFEDLHPVVVEALERLADGGASEAELAAPAYASADDNALLAYLEFMFHLSSICALRYTLLDGGRPVAELRWLCDGTALDPPQVQKGVRYRLSRFAVLRREGGTLVVESPLGRAQVRLLSDAAASAVTALAQPADGEDLARQVPGLGPEAAERLIDLLLFGAAVSATDEHGQIAAEECVPLRWWDQHDLWFHSRSRRGRHGSPYGGTFANGSTAQPPPLVREDAGENWVPLRKPDLQDLAANDEPLSSVLERRRSVREYAEAPINVDQLSEFLYRSARIKFVVPAEANGMQHCLKPAPSGGAIHEIDIYPVVASCDGLEPGLYRYNPLAHALARIDGMTPQVEQLLEEAWITGDRRSRPQVLLVLVARFGRMQWKYQGMVYATILKDVGALLATMYLVATSMKLAPCALGGGDSDLFALAADLDYLTESAVGEFLLGSRP